MDQQPLQHADPPPAAHVNPPPQARWRFPGGLLQHLLITFLSIWYTQYYTNGPLYRLLASTAPWTPDNLFVNPRGTLRNPYTRSVTTVADGTATRTLVQSYVRSTSSWTSTETRYSTAFHAYGPRHTHTVEYMFSTVVVSTEVSEISWTDITPPHNRAINERKAEDPPHTCRNIVPISPPIEDMSVILPWRDEDY